jgi:hypothetical protein
MNGHIFVTIIIYLLELLYILEPDIEMSVREYVWGTEPLYSDLVLFKILCSIEIFMIFLDVRSIEFLFGNHFGNWKNSFHNLMISRAYIKTLTVHKGYSQNFSALCNFYQFSCDARKVTDFNSAILAKHSYRKLCRLWSDDMDVPTDLGLLMSRW